MSYESFSEDFGLSPKEVEELKVTAFNVEFDYEESGRKWLAEKQEQAARARLARLDGFGRSALDKLIARVEFFANAVKSDDVVTVGDEAGHDWYTINNWIEMGKDTEGAQLTPFFVEGAPQEDVAFTHERPLLDVIHQQVETMPTYATAQDFVQAPVSPNYEHNHDGN